MTSLHYAALEGGLKNVDNLLSAGIPINSRDGAGGRTPLSYAAQGGNEEVVKLLLDRHADVDSLDGNGRGPLSYALTAPVKQRGVINALMRKSQDQWWESCDRHNHYEHEFHERVKGQSPDQQRRGRAEILSFGEGGVLRKQCSSSSEFLDGVLDCARFDNDQHRLIIMEDLAKDWIDVLGPILRIPVFFFALHLQKIEYHDLGRARAPIGNPLQHHFILNYRQPLSKDALTDTDTLECGAMRDIIKDPGQDSMLACDQLISYWGIKTDDTKPWIAVLLVDPTPANMIPESSPFTPYLSAIDESTGLAIGRTPIKCSMFDDLLSSHQGYVSKEPISATYQCLRIVLAKAVSAVDSSVGEAVRITRNAAFETMKFREFDFDNFEKEAWAEKWKKDHFTALWSIREDLELMSYRLESNRRIIKKLKGLDKSADSNYLHYTLSSLNSDRGIMMEKGEKNNISLTELRRQAEYDWQEWENLKDVEEYTFKLIARTTETYIQAVEATSAQFANIQALSTRRLTGLAAIFAPALLCAAVLTIPSFGGAGNTEKFWIFWVVSVPLAIIVAIIFLSGELTDERRQKVRDWFHAWKVWLLIRRTGRIKDGWRSSDIELRV